METPYCAFCPDDDLLFASAVEPLLDFLDSNPGFVAAHGNYVNFRPAQDFEITDIFYWAPSIDGDDPLQRIVQQMRNYQAIYYAIHRTAVTRTVHAELQRVQTSLGYELLSSSLTLIAGSVARLPRFYMGRNTSPSTPNLGWHPYHFLVDRPEQMFREYMTYRGILIERILADERWRARYDRARIERVLDLVHLRYLTPMLSSPVLDFVIDESLRADVVPADLSVAVWDRFERFSRPGGLIGMLRRLRSVLELPDPAKRFFRYLLRFPRMFVALARQLGPNITPTRGLRKIYVRRKARDGSARRYAIFYWFLNRRLSSGGAVSATDTAKILEELDDYV